MAKIEIYETENDVKREALKSEERTLRGRTMLGAELANLFGAFGLTYVFFEKTGLKKSIRESGFSTKLRSFDPFPGVTKAFEKHFTAVTLTMAGFFALMSAASFFKEKSVKKQLDQLGTEQPQQVIIPDNTSIAALNEFPIRPMDEQTLHKIPEASIKKHAERILQEVNAPQIKLL